MGKHKLAGGIVASFGIILFAFGFYILPFGTDIYLYFWVNRVFHGNWLYGSIAGNLFAIGMIVIGLFMMRKKDEDEKEDGDDMDVIIKPKTKSRRKTKKGGSEKWLRL